MSSSNEPQPGLYTVWLTPKLYLAYEEIVVANGNASGKRIIDKELKLSGGLGMAHAFEGDLSRLSKPFLEDPNLSLGLVELLKMNGVRIKVSATLQRNNGAIRLQNILSRIADPDLFSKVELEPEPPKDVFTYPGRRIVYDRPMRAHSSWVYRRPVFVNGKRQQDVNRLFDANNNALDAWIIVSKPGRFATLEEAKIARRNGR